LKENEIVNDLLQLFNLICINIIIASHPCSHPPYFQFAAVVLQWTGSPDLIRPVSR
jgi:hypothetical protein